MNYTPAQCLDDTMTLMPYARAVLDELGSLVRCARCGDRPHSVMAADIDGLTTVLALCEECDAGLCRSDSLALDGLTMGEDSHFILPDTDDGRMQMVDLFRKAIIFQIAERKELPVVMRLLELDCTSPTLLSARDRVAIVWTRGGKTLRAYRCPMPWFDSDPFLLGGKTARDASALVKSMLAAKTQCHSFWGGPFLLTSSDKRLMKAWGTKP